MVTGTCHGCGVEIPPSRGGGPRKWCSDRCRKVTLYGRPCVDCGTRTNGSDGFTGQSQRCIPCYHAHEHRVARRYVLDSIAEWADLFGAPPVAADWNLAHALAIGRPDRVERYEQTGRCGRILDDEPRYKVEGAPGPVVHCGDCFCHVAIPESVDG